MLNAADVKTTGSPTFLQQAYLTLCYCSTFGRHAFDNATFVGYDVKNGVECDCWQLNAVVSGVPVNETG